MKIRQDSAADFALTAVALLLLFVWQTPPGSWWCSVLWAAH